MDMKKTKLTTTNSISQDPFPGSKKVYIKGIMHNVNVAMREISLGDTHLVNGMVEHNAPVTVYDTSGPYTDPDIQIDVKQGIPRLREQWILDREDCVELNETSSACGETLPCWKREPTNRPNSVQAPMSG